MMVPICTILALILIPYVLFSRRLREFNMRRHERQWAMLNKYPVLRYAIATAFFGFGVFVLLDPRQESPGFAAAICWMLALVVVVPAFLAKGEPDKSRGISAGSRLYRR